MFFSLYYTTQHNIKPNHTMGKYINSTQKGSDNSEKSPKSSKKSSKMGLNSEFNGDESVYKQLRSRLVYWAPKKPKRSYKKRTGGQIKSNLGNGNLTVQVDNLVIDLTTRSTRESSPCTPPTGITPVIPRTPVPSSRKRASFFATNRVAGPLFTPPAGALVEFFGSRTAEKQKLFAEKYNYDVLNDVPLPGRFEWEKIEK